MAEIVMRFTGSNDAAVRFSVNGRSYRGKRGDTITVPEEDVVGLENTGSWLVVMPAIEPAPKKVEKPVEPLITEPLPRPAGKHRTTKPVEEIAEEPSEEADDNTA